MARAEPPEKIAVLNGHTDLVVSAAYSPDGSRIVTASDGTTARVWDVRYTSLAIPQLLAEACGGPLKGISKLTEAEMELVGAGDGGPGIDVCAGVTPDL